MYGCVGMYGAIKFIRCHCHKACQLTTKMSNMIPRTLACQFDLHCISVEIANFAYNFLITVGFMFETLLVSVNLLICEQFLKDHLHVMFLNTYTQLLLLLFANY